MKHAEAEKGMSDLEQELKALENQKTDLSNQLKVIQRDCAYNSDKYEQIIEFNTLKYENEIQVFETNKEKLNTLREELKESDELDNY